MGETTVQDKLISYLRDTHAMEMNVLQMLGSMISTTKDPEMKKALERHKDETEEHERSIRECLEAHNEAPATLTKDVPAVLGAMVKGLQDAVRTDRLERTRATDSSQSTLKSRPTSSSSVWPTEPDRENGRGRASKPLGRRTNGELHRSELGQGARHVLGGSGSPPERNRGER